MDDNDIAWFIEFKCDGRPELMTIHAKNQREAMVRFNNRMDEAYEITSISAL